MTKKDYDKIAYAMAHTRPTPDNLLLEQWRRDMITIGRALLADNPRFDSDQFRRACEANDG